MLISFDNGLALRGHLRMYGTWHVYAPGEAWTRPEREARLVLQLSCGAGLCSKEDTAQKLMAQVLAAPELKPSADAGKEDKR